MKWQRAQMGVGGGVGWDLTNELAGLLASELTIDL